MLLLTLVAGIVLFPKATTLKCYECYGSGNCTDAENECPSELSQCGVTRIISYVDGSKFSEVHLKTCVERCDEGSINFGNTKSSVTSKCCTSDLCNLQPAAEPNNPIPNGRKCFQCHGQTCTAPLSCEDDEDHCVTVAVAVGDAETQLKGCASSRVCSNINSQMASTFGGNIRCCQGDYCNSASSTGASLLLLVAPLVSLVIFS